MRHIAEESLSRLWSNDTPDAKSNTTPHYACAFQRLAESDHAPAVGASSAVEPFLYPRTFCTYAHLNSHSSKICLILNPESIDQSVCVAMS